MASCKVAIATNSLGKSAAGHHIFRKLEAAKRHGFDGVEVAFECIEAHGKLFADKRTREGRLRTATRDICDKATALGLAIVALNPFGAYDSLVEPSDVSCAYRRQSYGVSCVRSCDVLFCK